MDIKYRTDLLADVDAFCQEIRPIEDLCYLEHRFADCYCPYLGCWDSSQSST